MIKRQVYLTVAVAIYICLALDEFSIIRIMTNTLVLPRVDSFILQMGQDCLELVDCFL